jgi:lipid A 3-O-deacylase
LTRACRRSTRLLDVAARTASGRGKTAAVVLALVIGMAGAASADGPRMPAVGEYEFGLQSAYLWGVTNNAQAVVFLPRAGRVMWSGGDAHPGFVTLGIEGLFSHFYETNSAMELGGGPLLRYRMVRDWVQPYAEVGVGMLYNDLKNFSLSSRVLFSVSGAVGVEIPIGERFGVTTGYRFRHISNAGQSSINPGLNANLVVVGVSFLY